ncbi:Karyopherin functions in nuclear transport of protein [Nadsonia fulvescens var. elongata DSM 6958]|uniref:Karyopherin functions in nuclear transport of protein n=1 Tax=Nadsonia fulvescens var. elongata DSM 6958 TaxID=857566 RepID=A0A1E3PR63_9ASCO|nr:Karyopherin functions in nuclear transport of protein [Nadsonia fulvescens var. elongata DSM 6958]
MKNAYSFSLSLILVSCAMSVLPQEVTTSLVQLLVNLISSDNAIRSPAEESLNSHWISGEAQNLELLLVGLSEQSVIGESNMIRAFAAVLFRRIATKQPEDSTDVTSRIIDNISENAQAQIKTIYLQGFGSEQTNDVRHKIADSISEIAKAPKPQCWPELLPILFHGSSSPNPSIRESSFRIFAAVPNIITSDYLHNIVTVFETGFGDTEEDVRIATVSAFTNFFATLDKTSWPTLRPLLSNLLNVLPTLNTEEKSDQLASTLESVIELAGLAPKMFKPVFKDFIDFCITVTKNKDMDSTARLSALELLTTFAEEAPNMCKKEPTYAEQMVMQCLAMMTEVGEDDDDGSEWNNEDEINNSDDNDEEAVAARQSLDRLSLRLSGEVMLPPLFQWLPRMIGSENWREKHAALMAISSIAEGCRDLMIPELDKVLDMVIPLLNDPHSRVQWACCNALGQMSTDFANEIQNQFGPRILPALIPKLSNSSTFRVQSHAAAALVNFSESATNEILEPYLDGLLSNLLSLLQSPKRYVQEQVLTTIAIIAEAAKYKFSKYYDTMMPQLFNVLATDTGKEYRLLKAKSIECATLIALAVGKEQFAPHCQQLVQLLANIQTNATDDDDPCQTYLVHGWGRLCKLIGRDFLPYLSGVMPPLLEAAKVKPDLTLIEDEAEVENLEQQEGWEVIPLKGKHIGIHTASLDDKANAIELLSVYAAELGGDFYPYVREIVTEITVPSIAFFFHDGVRFSAAQAVPHLLNAAKAANPNDPTKVLELWSPIVAKLFDVLSIEPMVELLAVYYSALYQGIEIIGPNALSSDSMELFIKTLNNNLKDYIERVSFRNNENDEYTEETDGDEAEAVDEDLVSEMNKAIHSVFKSMRSKFLPYFDNIIPALSSFLNEDNVDARHWALCVVDDCIEFTGPESFKYQEIFLPKLVGALVDSDPAIRQAAAYGIGIAAQHGGQAYAQATVGSLETLFNVCNVPDSRSDDNVHVTENASCAISKILRTNGPLIGENLNPAIAEWIKTLPIVNDDEAAPYAYVFLANLMDEKHPAVMNQIPKVFESVVQALQYDAIRGKNAEGVVASTKGLLASVAPEQVITMAQGFSVELQQVVKKWFQ